MRSHSGVVSRYRGQHVLAFGDLAPRREKRFSRRVANGRTVREELDFHYFSIRIGRRRTQDNSRASGKAVFVCRACDFHQRRQARGCIVIDDFDRGLIFSECRAGRRIEADIKFFIRFHQVVALDREGNGLG